ncbi:SIR2 family protein [Aequorivita sp. F47161]|uniref:SIR2 family protein n=1 Tax=Aequorivita vitellina TaxID=2874475 RepID=A0A9X1U399_9FLAO|nr:SIR2 family protein [Aequorivita vitellina]MCG2419358.1 SIR2 family protein [Aequorivita vitellina]
MENMEEKAWHGNHVIKLREYKEPTIIDDLDTEYLRDIIEPWLTALFQSEHLSLLTGAGVSSAVHYLATGNAGAGMGSMAVTEFKEEIKIRAKESAERSGRGEPNIEDEIRTINELIKGLQILNTEELNNKLKTLEEELENGIEKFANSVLESEKNIVTSKKNEPAEYLMNFMLSFASRIATRERLNLFTTNYDRVLEFGAELAGLHLIDRFVGSISPIFRSSRLNIDLHYNPPGIRGEPRYLEGVINFTKLHGSLDWVAKDDVVKRFSLPYGAPNISTFNPEGSLMIYPNASKDRETAEYPYVELFRDFASSIIRPNSTIVTYGYSFGDDHINRVLRDMLTIPSTHIVIIAFDDVGDRIKRFYLSAKRPVQITLLLGKHFGDLKILVDNYLPKPAIDKTTYKMADLLKVRGVTASNSHKEEQNE